MDLQGTQQFTAPPQQVWNALMNPDVLKASIPNAQEVKIAGSAIEAMLRINLPGFDHTVSLAAQATEQTPPSHLVLALDRSGKLGDIKGTITIDLAPSGAGTTLTYNAHFDLGGMINMIPGKEMAAKQGLNTFFSNLSQKVG